MALDAELINLKSAGTYRFERDKSEISNDLTTVSNLRLVAGFSKMGPFNTVKLVTSPAQFIKLYGNIDRSLEKKGSFFHRSALVALSAGPILCLNLLNLDPDRDQVVEKSFSVNSGDVNKLSVTLPLQSLYNTDKFWFPSDEAFLDAIEKSLSPRNNTASTEENQNWQAGVLHFSNVGKKPVSILVKKASDYSSKGFDLTLNEWYGEGNVPEYLNGTSYVSDYLVEVYVVSGDFGPALKGSKFESSLDLDDDGAVDGQMDILTKYDIYTDEVTGEELPYKRFASDIVYQSFYDEKGFIRGENDVNLTKFLNLPSVDLRAKYVGSLIPNFIDKLGRNIWIQKLVNDDTDTIGLLCTENIAHLESVCLEHDFIDEKVDLIGHSIANLVVGADEEEVTLPKEIDFDFLSYKFKYEDKQQRVVVKYSDTTKLDREVYTNTPEANEDLELDGTEHPFAWVIDGSEEGMELLYADSSYLSVGSKLYLADTSGSNVEFTEAAVVEEIEEDVKPAVTEIATKANEDLKLDAAGNKPYIPRDNEAVVDRFSNIVVGDYLISDSYNVSEGSAHFIEDVAERAGVHARVTRVREVRNIYKDGERYGILVICSDKIKKITSSNIIIKITPIDKLADHFQWVCLNGFQISKEGMPNGTNERQNEILDMIREVPEFPSTTSNLFKALIDRDYVQWRYLVDTFGLGIEEECKKVYTQLCKARTSALAIVNCPSQLDFKKSTDPWFTNKSGGVEAEYISKGGDLSRNPSFLFTLPKIENGATYGAYYYPYLRITDLSAPKSVPPAAYVSNLYIQKYSRGFAWSIVAGQKRGVISGNQVVGVEATLVHDNRDWLEPMGINSIIWEQGVGVEVYANKTAKQTPVSALSSIHVREAAIYIQDNVESILRRYVFEFNTAQSRMEIKTLVDEFLTNMKNNGGLYDFRTVMDTSNNTPEVIDRNMGVIDIYVEIVRGLEIIAQRLTILRTGAIAAGGFDE
jgi:hypothetical protein